MFVLYYHRTINVELVSNISISLFDRDKFIYIIFCENNRRDNNITFKFCSKNVFESFEYFSRNTFLLLWIFKKLSLDNEHFMMIQNKKVNIYFSINLLLKIYYGRYTYINIYFINVVSPFFPYFLPLQFF